MPGDCSRASASLGVGLKLGQQKKEEREGVCVRVCARVRQQVSSCSVSVLWGVGAAASSNSICIF